MFPKPRADLKPNTLDFERLPLVKPTGFREYDARWLFPTEINLMGLNAIGVGLAQLAEELGRPKRFVVGHDFRSYSAAVKQGLITGLLAGGAEVHDIGLALSPMAYFAQFELERRGRGDGHRQPQRQRLDRHQDGPQPPAHLRSGGDDGAQEDRARGRLQRPRRRSLRVRARHGRALCRGSRRPAEAQAPPPRGVRLRQRHGGRLRPQGAGGHRLRGDPARLRASTTPSRATTPTRKT